jgi:hypothetical protein
LGIYNSIDSTYPCKSSGGLAKDEAPKITGYSKKLNIKILFGFLQRIKERIYKKIIKCAES